jgi:hypothetical protein
MKRSLEIDFQEQELHSQGGCLLVFFVFLILI